jgi:methionyl aminopeptidase
VTCLHSRPLLPTDIINIDVTIFASLPHELASESAAHPVPFHGDSSITICLPEVDDQGRELVEITQEALDIGINQCGPGRKFREIGCAIE